MKMMTQPFLWMLVMSLAVTLLAGPALAPPALVTPQPRVTFLPPGTRPVPVPTPAQTPTAPPPGAPVITGIEPSTIPYTGGTLTVMGDNFEPGAVVRVARRGALATTFINRGMLSALVPAGEPPGVYSLQVINPDGLAAVLYNALTITGAPSPTDWPATTTPGRPVLTVRNYSVSPQRPAAGGACTLQIEIYNTGSRGAENAIARFPGGQLVATGENTGYLLGAIGINQTRVLTQSFRVPTGLSGPASVTILMSANDYEGNHYDFQETVTIDVAGGGSGRPQVIVQRSASQPDDLAPGEAYSLTLVLKNQGPASATGVVLSVPSGGASLPVERASTVSIDRIGAGAVVTTVLPLRLADSAAVGRQAQAVRVEYGDYTGGRYTADFNVTLSVSADLSTRPQVIVQAYHTAPAILSPGNVFTLAMTLSNVGGGAAQRLMVTIGGTASATSASGLGPFAPLESSNVVFLGRLDSGQTKELAQPFIVDGQAKAGVYQLPVTLEYDDPRGPRRTDTQVISLLVIRAPLLRIGLLEPITQVLVGQPLDLSVEIINIGQSGANVNRVELASDSMDIVQGASTYVGPMDSGTTQSLQANVVARRAGPAAITVTVNYVDDLNRPQQITHALPFDVREIPKAPEPTPPPEASSGGVLDWLGRLLRGLFGLGS